MNLLVKSRAKSEMRKFVRKVVDCYVEILSKGEMGEVTGDSADWFAEAIPKSEVNE